MDSLISKKTGKPLVSNVRRKVIDKHYDWGLYVYKKADGRWFTDGTGSVLNIESMRGDIAKISQLKTVAKHYGDAGDGEAVFVPGLTRVTEEEYSAIMMFDKTDDQMAQYHNTTLGELLKISNTFAIKHEKSE
jgi:hypothetical protein